MSDHSNEAGRGLLASIMELVARFDSEDYKDREAAQDEAYEMPLSVLIRSEWYAPGKKANPAEFELLLGTGGPAVRIIGALNEYCEPISARLQNQDWFEPWRDLSLTSEEQSAALRFAQCFYYGE